jgi:hypothetical protein
VQHGRKENVRVAAMDLIRVKIGEGEVRRRIAEMAGTEDGWLEDMKWYAATFESLPGGGNEVLWARQLRHVEAGELGAAALRRHRKLKGAADYIFAPRFAAVLAYADETGVEMTRGELLADLRRRVAGKEHVNREGAHAGSVEDVDEELRANEKKLTRGDLLAMRMILMGLEDAATVRELYRQGMEDMSDTASEHGGLLVVREGKIVPRLYPAMYAENDFAYVMGDKVVRDMVTGVAAYQFHFQQVFNGERAGAGEGELKNVRRRRCNGVVITSVGTRRMDVVFYTPSGGVVDLGVWEAK